MPYPKRLIEVDLPIKRISAHAQREKSIRFGHITALHLWWARRPLSACRAVICASLWPDPADKNCPKEFIEFAKKEMLKWCDNDHLQLLSKESLQDFIKVNHKKDMVNNTLFLRQLLLDFIADFSNWDNSYEPEFLKTSKLLSKNSHISLGGDINSLPILLDSFAGGGSIPLEGLRVGAESFASDINPIPILLNKVLLEYVPKYGKELSDEVKYQAIRIKKKIESELGEYYPKDDTKTTPIAYLWARTIKCEGPNCGIEIPLMRSLWLAKKGTKNIGLRLVPYKEKKFIDFEIVVKKGNSWYLQNEKSVKINNPDFSGTVKRGSVTCPSCGFTIAVGSVREQLKPRYGGARDARLYAVVTNVDNGQGRSFRLPTKEDLKALKKAQNKLTELEQEHSGNYSLVPNEILPLMSGVFNAPIYGHTTWGSLFTARQALALSTLVKIVNDTISEVEQKKEKGIAKGVGIVLALAVSRLADISNSLCNWSISASQAVHLFGRQAIPMMWDFAETSLLSDAAGDITTTINNMVRILDNEVGINSPGQVIQANAAIHPLPDDYCSLFFTDPPYYNAVPYADLSDFFYVWLKRMLGTKLPELFIDELSPKSEEICEMAGWDSIRYSTKDKAFFEDKMQKAMSEGRRILRPDGLCVIVFAHKTTSGWEAQLKAMLDAGWVVTASWPIDTERGTRLRAQGSAALSSSVHLVCRPRENEEGSLVQNQIGDWRDVQEELPIRIHEWMPRLAAEGVAGADAIFACLGPALEVFSRYSSVEKPNGDIVTLREYLEKVWAAVSQEALNMVFTGGEAKGLEEDARLTAMWLWTLTAGASDNATSDEEDDSDEEESSSGGKLTGGFTLEYDTARKIAQGLGANLEDLKTLVEVKGDKARLLPVIERTSKLFGTAGIQHQPVRKRKEEQLTISFDDDEIETQSKLEISELKVEQTGKTVLDRLHQAMLLFSTGRSEALKRFLVEDGAGKEDRFWKLAQSLTSLYPKDTDERRWVEAVQTYKKSLGF